MKNVKLRLTKWSETNNKQGIISSKKTSQEGRGKRWPVATKEVGAKANPICFG